MNKDLIRRPDMADCIADRLREELSKHGKAGQRFHTVRTLCQRFEATTQTIRAALKILEREGWLDVWPGSGTFVRGADSRAQHVALVIAIHSDHSRLGYHYFRLMEFLHQFFAEAGLAPRLYWARSEAGAGGEDPSLIEFRRAVSRHEVAGVVVLKGTLGQSWWTAVEQSGRPVVGDDRKAAPYGVRLDYPAFLNEAVQFLAKAGRRQLALLAWSPGLPDPPEISGVDLMPLFPEVVRRHGCETRPEWLRGDLWPADSGAGYAMFREVWMGQTGKPDGLVISDEALFPDAATAILEIGIRVPKDLLVVTHANHGSGTLYPFPTVRLEYDPDETGRQLGVQLLRLLRQQPVPDAMVHMPFRWVGADVVQPPSVNRPDELPKLRSARS